LGKPRAFTRRQARPWQDWIEDLSGNRLMRLLDNLPVGRKLAASATLTMLMLGGLVAAVWLETGRVARLQHAQARSGAVLERVREGADALRIVPVHERDLLLTQDAAGQAPARARLLAGLDQGLRQVTEAVEQDDDPAVLRALDLLRAAAAAYRGVLEELADERARLVRMRDERLFQAGADYDPVFEAVNASIAFDMDGATAEEARQRLMTVHAAVNDVRLGAQRLLATGEDAQLRRVRRGIAQARVHGRGLSGLDAPARLRDDLARLTDKVLALAQGAEDLLAESELVARLREERVAVARRAVQAGIAAMDEAMREAGAQRSAALVAAADQARHVSLGVGLSIAVVLVLSALLLARTIGAPLHRLAAAMGAIAAGNTGVEVRDRGRRDEIGTIAEALETLRGTARQAFAQGQMLEQLPTAIMSADPKDGFRITYMNAETQRLMERLRADLPVPPDKLLGASFDVFHRDPGRQRALLSDPSRLPHTARIRLGPEVIELRVSAIRDAGGDYTGAMLSWSLATEKVRLADTFEREVGAVVEAVASSAERLQDSARQLSTAAATSGTEAEAVAEAGGRATADVQSVATAAEEMAASVAEIARRVGEAAEVASRAVSEARATDATVQGLSEAAARIGDVVRLIGDIAGQTNLLALNATIEAARAGEAGKGFAVVASEVKSLAGQTAKATEEIGRQIAEMQAATGQAVAAIRGIGATVERTSDIATTIAAAVEEQGSATQEIARSAAQVAAATGTVASRIEGVRAASVSTGQSAAAMRDDSGALAAQAATLREKASGFLRAVRAT
jgi:methyl-accepting chemotaxis protein